MLLVPCWEREVLVKEPVVSEGAPAVRGEEAASRVSQSQRLSKRLDVSLGRPSEVQL